ncbi:MAG: alcohol dehydrogenase catalytic domain-containing protein, partial [Candidatus Hermodarchaeota archaeon]
MKAAVFEKVKTPMKIDENYPSPDISGKSGQVILNIEACGVCHTDLGFLDHGVPTGKAPPLILGHEMSGKVAEMSDDV